MTVTPAAARFGRFVSPEPNTGCFLWGGYVDDKSGYGYFGLTRSKAIGAHRFAYELAKGPIPAGLHIDHLCRVRCCVNPDHLEAVTLEENVMRGVGFAPKNAAKTHCDNGHRFDEKNTGTRKEGWRVCKRCNADREHRRRQGLIARGINPWRKK